MGTPGYRLATAADAAAIRDLSLISYRQFSTVLAPEYWKKMYDGQEDAAALEALMDIAETFVYDAGGKLGGVVFLVPSGNPTAIYPADWAYIRRLGVDPVFRGQGIGKRLMKMVIETARSNGEVTLGLHTGTMMPDARHIYDRLGFELIRELAPILGQQYWLYKMSL